MTDGDIHREHSEKKCIESINQSIYFVTHKHYSQNNVIKQNIHIMCDG